MKYDDFRSGWILVVLLLGIFVAWVGWGMVGPHLASLWLLKGSPQTSGPWGDTFGALNTLFTGFAFVGALAAVMMQGETLRRQQADQHRQKFEANLFELFRMLRSARDEFEFKAGVERSSRSSRTSEGKHGLDAFREAALEMSFWVREGGGPDMFGAGDLARLYTKRIHRRRESLLGAYFRIMYTILRRIHDDPILTPSEKANYGNLLRTQMTSNEVALAGFNALAPYAKDFRDLITEFRILKYLPEGQRRRALYPHFPSQAFAGRED